MNVVKDVASLTELDDDEKKRVAAQESKKAEEKSETVKEVEGNRGINSKPKVAEQRQVAGTGTESEDQPPKSSGVSSSAMKDSKVALATAAASVEAATASAIATTASTGAKEKQDAESWYDARMGVEKGKKGVQFQGEATKAKQGEKDAMERQAVRQGRGQGNREIRRSKEGHRRAVTECGQSSVVAAVAADEAAAKASKKVSEKERRGVGVIVGDVARASDAGLPTGNPDAVSAPPGLVSPQDMLTSSSLGPFSSSDEDEDGDADDMNVLSDGEFSSCESVDAALFGAASSPNVIAVTGDE